MIFKNVEGGEKLKEPPTSRKPDVPSNPDVPSKPDVLSKPDVPSNPDVPSKPYVSSKKDIKEVCVFFMSWLSKQRQLIHFILLLG